MTAVPACVPALKMTVALPFVVPTSAGVTVPSVVVKVTIVPFCTAWPPTSSKLAVISAVPLIASTWVFTESLMVVPVGAKSGAFSHDAESAAARAMAVTVAALPPVALSRRFGIMDVAQQCTT
jgi:hypothetical protein